LSSADFGFGTSSSSSSPSSPSPSISKSSLSRSADGSLLISACSASSKTASSKTASSKTLSTPLPPRLACHCCSCSAASNSSSACRSAFPVKRSKTICRMEMGTYAFALLPSSSFPASLLLLVAPVHYSSVYHPSHGKFRSA
jgi:hypothetical protein